MLTEIRFVGKTKSIFATVVICMFLSVLAFGGQNTADNPVSKPEQSDLFVSGQEGYHTYRIPSVIVTQKGTVLAFCEGRKFRVNDASPTDMVMKRSFDDGRTWTPMQVVVKGVPDAIMDPCPVVDQTTGIIWLVYDRYPKDFNDAAGFGMNSGTAWVMHSTDDGATWSAPVNITATTKRHEWSVIAHGPGVGIAMRCGRLVIPCYRSIGPDPNTEYSFAIYSDDHGKSWHLGGETGPMTNESQVVELADGSLMLNMRTSRKTGCRVMAISRDNGMTWSEPVDVPELIEPACQASILRYSWPDKDGKSHILFCNPACKDDRIKLTVRLSYDEGRSWPVSKLLYAGPSAYCCLAALKDGDIACLYEGGDKYQHEKIIFARFSLEWLTDGKDKSN